VVAHKAFVVLKGGYAPDEKMARELRNFVNSRLAPYKYPRWVEFRDELPMTATGKIRRFKRRH
jgi:acyl-coenzyme A synthetase/AMP-(fatty) acid ligase